MANESIPPMAERLREAESLLEGLAGVMRAIEEQQTRPVNKNAVPVKLGSLMGGMAYEIERHLRRSSWHIKS